jgi:hypothetical protein
MPRLWDVIDGEPWMVNPARLGILGALNPGRGKRFDFHGAFTSKAKAVQREKQIPGAFILDRHGEHYVVTPKNPRKRNPKRRSKRMATAMQRRMAYVRSFQHNRRKRRSYALNPRRRRHYRMNRRRRHYRRNPYPMAGTVASLAGNPRRRRRHHYRMNRRHYRRNPGRVRRILSSSYFGLPSLETVGWSVVGFSGTAAIQSMLWGTTPGAGLIPATWATNADGTESKLAKYGVLLGSVILVHMAVRAFRPTWAAIATTGAGLYVASQAIVDFLPGVVPGFRAYTPLHAYTPLRAYHRWSMPQLASQNIGAGNLPVGWNQYGGMDILAQRLRRFN